MKSSLLLPLAIFADRSFRNRLDLIASSITSAEEILSAQNICDYNSIVVASYPGLTFDDLYALPSSSPITRRYQQASVKAFELNPFEPNSIATSLAQKCGLPIVQGDTHERGVLVFTLPNVDRAHTRQEAVSESLVQLYQRIAHLEPDSTVVVVEGLPTLDKTGTQSKRTGDDSRSPFFSEERIRDSNSTAPRPGLLQKYQLLTPNLLLATLVSLLVLFPIIWFGVSALSSIEIPTNMGDIAKSEKRN